MGTKKETGEKTVKMCEVEQDLRFIPSFDTFIQGVNHSRVAQWAYCVHDKDMDPKTGTMVHPHVHVMLKLRDSCTFKYIASWFGVAAERVEMIAAPRFNGALPYLVHANAPKKYQYDVREVQAIFVYADFLNTWKEEVAKKANGNNQKEESRKLDEYLQRICDGEIRQFNYTDFIDGVIYSKYRSKIENAFKFYIEKNKDAERDIKCFYMVGSSGTGKTTYAKQWAKDEGYSFYVSSGSNDVMDGYAGQDCLILDDLRPSCLGLSDLLKMLDNNTSTSVKSRYYNKSLFCKLIIITTVKPLDEFFQKVFEHDNEPIVQLKRRCDRYFKFTNDGIDIFGYDLLKDEYVHSMFIDNPVAKKYPKKPFDATELRAELLAHGCVERIDPEHVVIIPCEKSISRATSEEISIDDLKMI